MTTTLTLETDYLIVGCGAAGMAFADSLITESEARSNDGNKPDIIMVDRRHSPGGHWIEAYPFVRLHQPAAFYGVSSTPLGPETIDQHGENKGMYYRAGAAEICGYYDYVMQHRLLASGRARYFPMSSYVGKDKDGDHHRFISLTTGSTQHVKVRKKIVDATYLEGAFPASTPPPFEVVEGARCIPVGRLADLKTQPLGGYVIIGGGKTALDACSWLLDNGVAPSSIRWIKPREAWFLNRTYLQGGDLSAALMEGLAVQVEALAQASSIDELFSRLEEAKQVLRVDSSVTPTMFRGPTLSVREVDQLRLIKDVTRAKVQCIERDRIILDEGKATIPTSPDHLHVHCAAQGLGSAKAIPIFTSNDRITLQSIRLGLLPFAAAITAFVEVTRSDDDLAAKNQLCPPSAQPNTPLDWLRGTLVGMKADFLWSKQPDIAEWLNKSRLNISRGIRERAKVDANLAKAFGRYATSARPALANLERLVASA